VHKILLILQYQHVDNEFSERAVLFDARKRHTELVQIFSILADLSQRVNPGLQSKRLASDKPPELWNSRSSMHCASFLILFLSSDLKYDLKALRNTYSCTIRNYRDQQGL